MNLTSLIGPAVVAAVIASVVSVIGFLINRATMRGMHSERLAFDREQTERRTSAEIALTERKITADIALTEKRLALDRALAAWKRRTEFAEEVLADFYQAREIIRGARSPASFDNEGDTRTKAGWETESDTRTLNAYFATTERLMSKGEFFAQLLARRYRFLALFGPAAAMPYDDLFRIRNEMIIAVRMLLSTHQQRGEGSLPQNRRAWERVIWDMGADDDLIAGRLTRVVADIEAICRPVIQDSVP